MKFYLFLILVLPYLSCGKKEFIFQSEGMKLQLELVVEGLDIPWSFVFLQNSSSPDILITEKKGRILWHKGGDPSDKAAEVQGVPKVYDGGQGGLMDIVLHPQFPEKPWIYLTYSISTKEGKTTRVGRARWDQGHLKNFEVLFTARPSFRQNIHFGSRLVFDSKGFMFFSVGDRGNRDLAQSLQTHNGKIMRLHEDGSVPEDNPFRESGLGEIWSYGHRNPQGLVFKNEELWSHEHGPRGGDEINLIQKGKNYGWPIVTYGREYIGGSIGEDVSRPGMEDSKKYYIPSIAPSGMAYYDGNLFSAWKGSFFIGSLVFRRLHRVFGKNLSQEEKLLEFLKKRVRDVRVSPAGFIYVSVENGFIFKVKTQKE